MLLVFLLLPLALAVDLSVFKTCSQNGFCHRNTHLARNIASDPDFESPYRVEMGSLHWDAKTLSGTVVKSLEDGSFRGLSLAIQVMEQGQIRISLDEERTPPRYNETARWAFLNPKPDLVQPRLANGKISYNDYDILVSNPFKVEVKYKGKVAAVVNDRMFLNLEHSRQKGDSLSNYESPYNMFRDTFKDSRKDSLPLGPESVAVDITLPHVNHVYGIPEHTDSLLLKDRLYRLYNVDIFEYETDSAMPMYGSIPFMMGVSSQHSVGVFWLNAADTYIDISGYPKQTHWMSESGVLDLVIMVADSPKHVSTMYTRLTGTPALPNQFALGYHQSRWNYNDEEDVLEIDSLFDSNHIPCDAIWLDVEYTDKRKYFTWQQDKFPDPDRMNSVLSSHGRNLVVIIDPHLKVGYSVSEKVEARNLAICDHNGNVFHGECWPGESVWIDTLNPEASEFWQSLYQNGSDLVGDSGNVFIWNDMSEPSVFKGPETSAPKDLVHFGGWEHRSVHNLYSLTVHESTFQAYQKRFSHNKRPFILTRAFFAGSQRTAAAWTGDNQASWEYLEASLPTVLSLNTVSMPYVGADVGGFFGDPSKELLVRWYQLGIWYPFFRAHAHMDSLRREPWVAGGIYTEHIRSALFLRQTLSPVWYNAAWRSSLDGSPVLTPMFYRHPDIGSTYALDNQFYLENIIVRPITEKYAPTAEVLLPENTLYYEWDSWVAFQGGQTVSVPSALGKVPMFLRSGSIVPLKPRQRRSLQATRLDPYTLIVAVDPSGAAEGELYVDDGESYAYEQGEFLHLFFSFNDGVLISKGGSSYFDWLKVERVVFVGLEIESATVKQDGKTWKVQVDNGVVKNPAVHVNRDFEIKVE